MSSHALKRCGILSQALFSDTEILYIHTCFASKVCSLVHWCLNNSTLTPNIILSCSKAGSIAVFSGVWSVKRGKRKYWSNISLTFYYICYCLIHCSIMFSGKTFCDINARSPIEVMLCEDLVSWVWISLICQGTKPPLKFSQSWSNMQV